MLEFRCADVGVACRSSVTGRDPDELLKRIAEHAAGKHGVAQLNQTLVNYALKHVRGTAEPEDSNR
ncbi:hypothetical protein BH20ACT24_BH20ACT24_12530 [soil metagenome]